jgi:hypothetical protein
MKEAQSAKRTALSLAAILGIVLMILANGCASTTGASPSSGNPSPEQAAFIAAAGKCSETSMTATGIAGTFTYSVSPDCTFTKTLVRLNESETQGIKTMLEGKNMTCVYTPGNFDSRWVTSLVGGMEYCNGDLKDALANLIIFTT